MQPSVWKVPPKRTKEILLSDGTSCRSNCIQFTTRQEKPTAVAVRRHHTRRKSWPDTTPLKE